MVTTTAAPHLTRYVDEDPTGRDPFPWHVARRRALRRAPEPLETLPLPAGLAESMLPTGLRPSGAPQTRVAIVRVARELARQYREARGCMLRTDAASVERMQRHLLAQATEVLAGRTDARALAPEVVRHGVVLGEIVARALGATWTDLAGDRPGTWQLVVPPGTLVCPVARVHRFLLRRNREQDLVGFFLELAS
jgi:hypothetical protein